MSVLKVTLLTPVKKTQAGEGRWHIISMAATHSLPEAHL